MHIVHPQRAVAATNEGGPRSAAAMRVCAVLAGVLAAAFAMAAQASARAATRPWLRPVPGDVVRPFDYSTEAPFVGGAHRGVDLAATSGTRVRAACAGFVLHAGPVARLGKVVSVRCGAYRVTYLPLATVHARRGTQIARGAAIGTVAAGHGGLHVGVRRAADRLAYEDPMSRFGRDDLPPLPVAAPARRVPATPIPAPRLPGVRPIPVVRPRPARPVAGRAPATSTAPAQAPATRLEPTPNEPTPMLTRPRGGARAPADGFAPWPVWAGAALVLGGCAGTYTLGARRRGRAARQSLAAAGATR